MVDVTELKHYLHRANLHRTNPSLFKRINDIASWSDFKEEWSLEQMTAFFTEADIAVDENQNEQSQRKMPSIDQLVSLFETLDNNNNGFLTTNDMTLFIRNFKALRQAYGGVEMEVSLS